MSSHHELLRRYAEGSAPTEVERERVLRRVEASMSRPRALDAAPVPAPGAASRVLARLDAPARRPARTGLPIAALIAIVALLFVSETGPPAPYDQELAGTSRLRLSPEVELGVDGAGRVTGTRFHPVVTWQIGRLDVDVRAEQGVALAVDTREARVEVVGTAFSVVRDARGTMVSVAHGRVRVTCTSGDPALLGEGEQAECRPVSAAGLLARAQAERAGGVATAVVLADLRAGLGTAGPEAVHQELRALLVKVLLEEGSRAEAAAVATEYTTVGGPRSDELRAMIAATPEGR